MELETSRTILTQYLTLRGIVDRQQIDINIKDFEKDGFFFNSPATLCIWIHRMNKSHLRSLIASIHWNKQLIIIVYTIKITNECIKDINVINLQKKQIETFYIGELQYNIFKNIINPIARVLNDEESQELVKLYTPQSLPVISITDPVCRYLGCNKGSILMFIRRDSSIYFRLCST